QALGCVIGCFFDCDLARNLLGTRLGAYLGACFGSLGRPLRLGLARAWSCALADSLAYRLAHWGPHGSRTVACANATLPSRRPWKLIFSLVVALTPTRSIEMPAIAAMRARMASRCGPTFGASHTMVRSRCMSLPPRCLMRSTAKCKNWSDEAPF